MAARKSRSRQTALVTGASSGIGLELAKIFATHGFDLIVVARREAQLEALAEHCRKEHGIRVRAMPADLLQPDAPRELVERVQDAKLEVDVLVNNAGLLDMGEFAEIDVEAHDRLIQLNIGVLTALTRRLLPAMLERGHGRILNVASTSSFQPVPTLALYAASKAFVLSLSEALAEELKTSGITVTALCPGFTKTEMLDRAHEQNATARAIPDLLVSEASDVAREGYEACMAGQRVVVPGLPNRLLANAAPFVPRAVLWAVNDLANRTATLWSPSD